MSERPRKPPDPAGAPPTIQVPLANTIDSGQVPKQLDALAKTMDSSGELTRPDLVVAGTSASKALALAPSLNEPALSDALGATLDSSDLADRSGRPVTITTDPSLADARPGDFTGDDRYQVIRRLGAGGMGVVYEALDVERQTTVALKTLLHVDAESIYRHKREFRSLTDVRHANLVRLYDLVAFPGRCYFTMELVRGVPFVSYCRPDPDPNAPIQIERLRSCFRQLVQGVSALHAAGVIHRDLKPSNVLVTAEGRVVILDFGLALVNSSATRPDREEERTQGTPAYMAPEQARGKTGGEASDWYAVGAMLYEALTGRLPFDGTLVEMLLAKQTTDPVRPSLVAKGVPADLELLSMDLQAREPARRPTVNEILASLDGNASGAQDERSSSSATSVFVGRTAALSTLHEALRESRDGRPVLAQVHGLSGMGKSTLIERFLTEARAREGAIVLFGRCYERESVPYKAFDSLIDELTRHLNLLDSGMLKERIPPGAQALVRVFPVIGRVAEFHRAAQESAEAPDLQELRRRSSMALKELLRRIAADRPLVLAIDDAQWGDADSATLASELLAPPGAPAALVLLSYRSDEADHSPFLRGLSDAVKGARVREVDLAPLGASEALEMARRLLGPSAADALARAGSIAANAEGSPFFIRELALQAPSEQSTTDLESLLNARIDRLPESARSVLEVLALAARPLQDTVALAVAGVADREAALDTLHTGRFIRSAADLTQLYTYHDRIRQAVAKRVTPERFRACHERLAETLETTGLGSAEQLAEHYRSAGNREKSGRYAYQAAEQAAQALAFGRAAELYQMAFDLAAEPKPEAVRRKIAEALVNAGRSYEAAQHYEEAAKHASELDAVKLQWLAAEQYMRACHQDKGAQTIRPALATVGLNWPEGKWSTALRMIGRTVQLRTRGVKFQERIGQLPADELARLEMCGAVAWGLAGFEFLRPTYYTARYMLLALDAGDPYHVGRGIASQAVYAAWGGSWGWAAQLLAMAFQLAEKLRSPELQGRALFAAGCIRSTEARWSEAIKHLDQALEVWRNQCSDLAFESSLAEWFSQWSLWQMGDLAELSRRATIWVKEGRQRGDIVADMVFRVSYVAYTQLAMEDDPDAAARELHDALEGVPPRAADWGPFDHWARLVVPGSIAIYRGDGAAAWKLMLAEWPTMKGSLILNSRWHRIEAMFVRGRSAILAALGSTGGESKRLYREAERAAAKLAGENLEWPKALARLLRGTIALARKQPGRAAPEFEAAAASFDLQEMALHAEVARRRLGQIRGGDEGGAMIARADERMRARGVKRPEGWARLLTPGE